MTKKHIISGLALTIAMASAGSAFGAVIQTVGYTYLGSATQEAYNDWAIPDNAETSMDFSEVLSNPTDAAYKDYIHAFKVTFKIDGLSADENACNFALNVNAGSGLTLKGTSLNSDGNPILFTFNNTPVRYEPIGTGDNGTPNDAKNVSFVVSKSNAFKRRPGENETQATGTKWEYPLWVGTVAVKWDGTTTTTLTASGVSGNTLSTYTGNTSTTAGTQVSKLLGTDFTVTSTPVAFTAPATTDPKFLASFTNAAANDVHGGVQVFKVGVSEYYSTVNSIGHPITEDGVVKGSTKIYSMNAQSQEVAPFSAGEGSAWVLAEFDLGTGTLGDLLSHFRTTFNDTDNSKVLWNDLAATDEFDNIFASDYYVNRGFDKAKTLVFKFAVPSGTTPAYFNWDLTDTPYSVTKIAAVPEPASLGLLAIGAMGLISRRRK